ncbi:PAS/PAC sensor signal transduction histidine kinase [Geobacter argillaceus]|uniref:histidine kinase n=2 Tax=Geobacter argillaceus TaxID=345631 RepID=A0A562VG41_9BACT|nr:ATP-binding protein [Geobacter argillaceus]TWJ16875.1 PAS/PAC sensor signal transduction histidine kinase [Geobacter argillaceus]
MIFSIRAKLLATYLLLLAVMTGTLYGYLHHALPTSIIATQRDNLVNQVRLASVVAGREIADLHRDAPRVATLIGRTVNARVTIIAPDGKVVGDSEVPEQGLTALDNHATRPEVLEARRSGTGSATRYSATLRTDMLYAAVPLAVGATQGAIVRLALPLTVVVKKATDGMETTMGISLLVALVLAAVFSTLLSQITSRPLRQVAAIATEIGRGNFHRRLPVEWRDELGDLARVMNEMAGRLENELSRLSSEKDRLDAILRGMGEGLMVTDGKGAISLVNPAFCGLFGVHDTIVGRPLIDISRHPTLNDSYKLVTRTRNELQEEITIQMPVETTIRTHWVPLQTGEELRGVVAVFHDISDMKRLEKVRKDFVANVSHELRTPVTVIKGYAETLLDGVISQDPTRAIRFVEIIQNHAERLASLIGDLLSLSELESATFSLQLQKISLEGTIRRSCSLLEAKAAAKKITVIPPTGELPQVLADQGRLEQVLVNLLDNAIKYTPAEGSVSINVAEEEGQLNVSVSDTGPGIPPESISRIFERFYRVDASRSRDEGGTGLGLSIVKHIVQLHGGTVRVANNPIQGTTFTFSLKKAVSS